MSNTPRGGVFVNPVLILGNHVKEILLQDVSPNLIRWFHLQAYPMGSTSLRPKASVSRTFFLHKNQVRYTTYLAMFSWITINRLDVTRLLLCAQDSRLTNHLTFIK